MKKFKNPSDIKYGIIGYGGQFSMGQFHIDLMKKAGMTLVAICDTDPARLTAAKKDFARSGRGGGTGGTGGAGGAGGIETYQSLAQMLKASDVDLITHITPHNLHYKLAAQCLRAGKHVVTEKPFVITTQECDKLINLAKAKRAMISTFHNRHWDAWIMRAVREIKTKQNFGEIVSIDAAMGQYEMPKTWWRSSKSISGGILYDWGVHFLEYCLQLIDSPIAEVTGFASGGHWSKQMKKSHPWKRDCIEDDACAIVRFGNGVRVNLNVSQLDALPNPYFLTIRCTGGTYGIAFDHWKTFKPGRSGKIIEKSGKHAKPRHDLYYKNIAAYLTGQEKLVITPQWARRPIHIIDLANRSAALGKTLVAKYV